MINSPLSLRARQWLLTGVTMLITITATADDAVRHFSRQCTIGKRQAAIIIVGATRDAVSVEQLIAKIIDATGRMESSLDAQRSESEISKLNTAAGKETLVASQVIEILQSAKKISQWTDGAFDVASGSTGGNYKSIRVDEKKSTVKLAKGMSIHLDDLMDGYLADLIIRYVTTAGMQGALVRVGSWAAELSAAPHEPQNRPSPGTAPKHEGQDRIGREGNPSSGAYQTSHLFFGFIADPASPEKARAKFGLLARDPRTRNLSGECGSVVT